MFTVQEIIVSALIAGVLAAAVVLAWPLARRPHRFGRAGPTTALGFMAWNFTLNAANATGFNVDAPIIGLSWQDAGSGVLALAATALALGLIAERDEPAGWLARRPSLDSSR